MLQLGDIVICWHYARRPRSIDQCGVIRKPRYCNYRGGIVRDRECTVVGIDVVDVLEVTKSPDEI